MVTFHLPYSHIGLIDKYITSILNNLSNRVQNQIKLGDNRPLHTSTG